MQQTKDGHVTQHWTLNIIHPQIIEAYILVIMTKKESVRDVVDKIPFK